MNSFPLLFVWLAFTHADRSRDIFLLSVESSFAVVGAVPSSVTSVPNATFTLTVVAASPRAVPVVSFTKSRPVDNSSWIMY